MTEWTKNPALSSESAASAPKFGPEVGSAKLAAVVTVWFDGRVFVESVVGHKTARTQLSAASQWDDLIKAIYKDSSMVKLEDVQSVGARSTPATTSTTE